MKNELMSYDAWIYKYCILILLTQFLIIIKAKLIWMRVLTNLKIKKSIIWLILNILDDRAMYEQKLHANVNKMATTTIWRELQQWRPRTDLFFFFSIIT